MTLRLTCEVLGCRRTRGQRKGEPPIAGDEQWVCGVHWPAVPLKFRRHLAACRRAMKRAPTRKNIGRAWFAWQRCRRAAIEAAVGL
jgi:hypothetical protein